MGMIHEIRMYGHSNCKNATSDMVPVFLVFW